MKMVRHVVMEIIIAISLLVGWSVKTVIAGIVCMGLLMLVGYIANQLLDHFINI